MSSGSSLSEHNKETLLRLLEQAIKKSAPKEEFGLLFSGGIDSALLALLFKKLGLNFKCFFGYVKGLGKPRDLEYAELVAKKLGVQLETATASFKNVPRLLSSIIPIIGSTNPVQVGVALPIALACRRAKDSGIKVVFSGMGADELFAGYAKFRESRDIAEQSLELLEQLPAHDLKRDLAIAERNGLSLKVPFLDTDVANFALSLGVEFKLSGQQNKVILRQLARSLGLDEEIAERKKLAAQYGSNFDKALEKLARASKKTKSAYLEGFLAAPPATSPEAFAGEETAAQKPEPVLGKPVAPGEKPAIAALSSGGKDSCLALWLMQKSGFKVKCLVSILPRNPDSYMYHQPNLEVLMLQSKALGIPLVFERTPGEKEEELSALETALAEAKESYGIQGVVSGALFSEYQKTRITRICSSLGLKSYCPLWHKDQVEELGQLVKSGFVFIISKVASKGFGKEWLGRRIGNAEVEKLAALSKKYKSNPAGEGGEFESIVLDGPNFKSRIKIISSRKDMQNEFTGSLEILEAALEPK